jgi:mono/diheme cytochrome c family protein
MNIKKVLLYLVIAVSILVLAFIIIVQTTTIPVLENEARALTITYDSARIAEGERIVGTMCYQCHLGEDGKMSGKEMLDAPQFGRLFSKNITNHPEKGIAKYTDGELEYLFRTGIKKNGEYAPPWMPKYPLMSDEDIASVIAFLRSDHKWVQASENVPPTTEPSFLAKFLIRIGAIGPLPFPKGKIAPPDTNNMVDFGRYIAVGKFECFSCHSADFAKQSQIEPESSVGFMGGGNPMVNPQGEVIHSANLTMDKATGLGNWTEEEFVRAVKTGVLSGNKSVRLPMVPYHLLTEKEIKAVWAWLQTVPVISNEKG